MHYFTLWSFNGRLLYLCLDIINTVLHSYLWRTLLHDYKIVRNIFIWYYKYYVHLNTTRLIIDLFWVQRYINWLNSRLMVQFPIKSWCQLSIYISLAFKDFINSARNSYQLLSNPKANKGVSVYEYYIYMVSCLYC